MNSAELGDELESYRRELLAHCYRMLGSADEAEDLVQEVLLRAWRSRAGFEGRSSLRVWLYRIATNACLTALQQQGRRALPSGLGAPGSDPAALPGPVDPQVAWVEPIPDARVVPESGDPAAVVAAREMLRLALIASLQYLPPRQRAVLLLRDVLGFPASEVAAMLGISAVAVKSALQRARVRLSEASPTPGRLVEPTDPWAREQLVTANSYRNPALVAKMAVIIADTDAEARALVPPGSSFAFPGDLGSYGLIGTADTVKQRIAAFEEAGAQELIIGFQDPTSVEQVVRFAALFG
ncbi:MAG TPA: RNA polymerase subunit sigma-70 [Trebonia sp.]